MSRDSKVVMNWDCATQGCFNRKKRLKFSVFKDSLPGRISFSDVDGIVEINGNLLLLEWKNHRELGTGQRILFERLTRFCPATALIVKGDAESMAVESVAVAWDGEIGRPKQASLGSLRQMIQKWAKWAMDNPVTRQPQEAVCA